MLVEGEKKKEFYLNYVECKEAKSKFSFAKAIRFYLNYVECKAVNLVVVLLAVNGFI